MLTSDEVANMSACMTWSKEDFNLHFPYVERITIADLDSYTRYFIAVTSIDTCNGGAFIFQLKIAPGMIPIKLGLESGLVG